MSAAALSGCAGDFTTDVASTATVNELGTIQGSNYGGHAPVVGSKVFVLEATTNGYGAVAKSLLSPSYKSATYPTMQDTSGSVTNGLYYVKTDSSGSFNITGDYTCDVGKPVYLYAAGGNPMTTPAVTISKAVVSGTPGDYTITFTTGGQLLYQGESVTFTGDSSTFGKYINGQTLTVLGTSNLTTSSFQVTTGSLTNGTYTIAATTYSGLTVTAAQASAPSNLAIVNMAMLGLCPSSGNFTNALSFVYMNEVSTVAMSYAMAGFATDSLHIGSSATNLVGLQNAALNAATLYNIQGSGPISPAGDGEGHVANTVNPNNGNGVVPQQTINTLANIVANCVDSSNTSVGTTPAALAAESPSCSGLFLATTSDGVTVSKSNGGATVPIDTATAMINLAHYPAGINTYPTNSAVDSSNPSTLFNLPTGNVPFAPQLGAAPKDWTIALTYKNIATPSAIAIDGNGDAYVGTYSLTGGTITELGPQGAVSATSTTTVPSLYSVAVSPTLSGAYTVWATSNAAASQMYKFSSSLATVTPVVLGVNKASAMAIDSAGNVYVANDSSNYPFFDLQEYNSAGTLTHYETNSNFSTTNGMALASNGNVWVSNTNNSFGLYGNPSLVANGTNVYANPSAGFTNTDAIAVDYQGNAWETGKQTGNQSLTQLTTGGTLTSYGINNYDNTAIGGLNNPVAVAVDGSNINNSNRFNVWVANSGNSTVSEINSSTQYAALSPSAGYQSGTGAVNTPSAIAVDNSGNVWVTNQGNSTVMEIIGSATPVTTPLSLQKPGVAP